MELFWRVYNMVGDEEEWLPCSFEIKESIC